MASLLLLLFLVSTNYLAIGALEGESMISTNEATEGQFTYQAMIMGKENGTEVSVLQGSAGIISEKHLLGAAQVFIDEKGNHKKLTFSAVVDQINAKSDILVLREIVRFFLPGPGGYQENDIAISELLVGLPLQNNPKLSQLKIPESPPPVGTPLAIVAGYGLNYIETEPLQRKLGVRIKHGTTDGKLRYERVKILSDLNCVPYKRRIRYLCGQTLPDYNHPDKRGRGLCMFDYGGPLVVNENGRNMVVAVASKNNNYCDDENLGGLYTEVSRNYWFIHGVLNNQLVDSVLVYVNRHHTMDNVLPEGEISHEQKRIKIS